MLAHHKKRILAVFDRVFGLLELCHGGHGGGSGCNSQQNTCELVHVVSFMHRQTKVSDGVSVEKPAGGSPGCFCDFGHNRVLFNQREMTW